MECLFIGIMTGTSLDGLDTVLVDCTAPMPHVLHSVSMNYPADLKTEMLALQQGADGAGVNELHRARQAGIALSALHSQSVAQLLSESNTPANKIAAIGVHGQTVRHAPNLGDLGKYSYTSQLIEPARIAFDTGCTVVADFRAKDIAAGGQGAPLVPAFHAQMFATLVQQHAKPVAVVNIGGFANASVVHTKAELLQGFDTGPGNVLMDGWAQRHLGTPYDANGAWAASAAPDAPLLSQLLSHPFFTQALPKSTGREEFNLAWLDAVLTQYPALTPATVQATLCALTARSIATALAHYRHEQPNNVFVCGGGAENTTLMAMLQVAVQTTQPGCTVASTNALGLAPQLVEATAFAWLAKQCLARQPIALSSVTGARGAQVLGAVYYA